MIWCVEDDASIRDIEVYALRSSGFEARGFEDGAEFWEAAQVELPELVVLDVMLPGIDGIELLRRMKASPRLSGVPVVMATARGAEYDRIQGLDLGADYYLVKPFGVMEMVSCVKAVLRRCAPQKSEHLLTAGGLSVNLDEHTVLADGKRITLTLKEYELLRYLMLNEDIVLSRDSIMFNVWGVDFEGESRTVDMHIKTLRQKLGPWGKQIRTVRGVGYAINSESSGE